MRKTILCLSLAGTLLFGTAFILSWLNPIWIERMASTAVRVEVERAAGERVDALSGAPIVGLAQRALGRTDAEIERTREAMRSEIPANVARVATAMLDPDCACRARLKSAADASRRQHLHSLSQLRVRLTSLIESAYADVRAKLLREFRIFTASNAAALAMLGAVTLVRPKARLQLMLPAAALAGGVVVTTGLYLFAQDWLHTILFNDYVGLGYVIWLSVVILLLTDILGNRARVSTRMANGVLQIVGAAVVAVPC
ncbi:hypothetical protein GJ700_21695 [Duganella sp. FT92W]|uniref:Uncharacterized protein n=1 Tax=Pseudoduganella rivuli TaxID=2666085 RepID=A0A7X2LVX3_9BURK|nr:hypothetical protein [Pseudoduganella rivuli]MRV74324.1 hypothetical protein [Pseudoduganella rivuli]